MSQKNLLMEETMRRLLLVVLMAATLASAQERVLVSSHNEVLPLKKGEPVLEALKRYSKQKQLLRTLDACSNPIQSGYDPADFPPMGFINAYHKDMYAEWLNAPADGVIDSVYFTTGNFVPWDSTLYLRIMESRIYTGSGPGYGQFSTYLPPVMEDDSGGIGPELFLPLCWGYFNDTNDLDGQQNNPAYFPGMGIGGVAAFAEDATPPDSTAWVSTLHFEFPHPPVTFPPTGNEIWGAGGFAIPCQPQ